MGNKKEKKLKGVVSPAMKFGACSIKQAIKNMQVDDNKTDDKQAHNLNSLNREKRKYLLFVPESGPLDSQLRKIES
jgi:hypothetical protein